MWLLGLATAVLMRWLKRDIANNRRSSGDWDPGRRRPIDHGHAVPGFTGLMAVRAIAGDPGVLHGRARTECREHRGRVTVLACQTVDRQVRCGRFLGRDVGKGQARGVALRAVVGDAREVHRIHGVVRRVRVTQRARLQCRDVIRRFARDAGRERGGRGVTIEQSPVVGWLGSCAAVGRSTMVTPYQVLPVSWQLAQLLVIPMCFMAVPGPNAVNTVGE